MIKTKQNQNKYGALNSKFWENILNSEYLIVLLHSNLMMRESNKINLYENTFLNQFLKVKLSVFSTYFYK